MKKITQLLVFGLLAMLPSVAMADNVVTAMTWNETDKCYYPTYSESGEVKTTKYIKTSWYDLTADVSSLTGVTDASNGSGTTMSPNGFTGDKVIRYQFSSGNTANSNAYKGLSIPKNIYAFAGYGWHAQGNVNVTLKTFISAQILELTWIQGDGGNNGTATISSPNASGTDYSTTSTISIKDRGSNYLCRTLNVYTPLDNVVTKIGTSFANETLNSVNLYCNDGTTTGANSVIAPYSIDLLTSSLAASEPDYRMLVTNNHQISDNLTAEMLNSVIPAEKKNYVFYRVDAANNHIGSMATVNSCTVSGTTPTYVHFNLYDGSDYRLKQSGTATAATYNRTFTADIPQTVCLPFALTADEVTAAGKFYALSSMSSSTITFAEQSTTTANHAYIFVPNTTGQLTISANKSFSVGKANNELYDEKITVNNNSLVLAGVHITETTTPQISPHADYNLYVFTTTGELKRVSTSSGITLKPFRGYLRVRTNQYDPDAANARPLTFALGDDGNGALGISAVSGMEEIFRSQFYDLQGRKVTAPTKGLYIVNGKKVLIK